MGDMLSPQVRVREFNLDLVVPQVSDSRGAYAGIMRWGPCEQLLLIDSEALLVERYGKPSNLNAEGWFCLSNFLAYGGVSWVSRAANTTSTNNQVAAHSAIANSAAVANVVLQVVKNEEHYTVMDGTFDGDLHYVARYPGAMGNSLRICTAYDAEDWQSSINLASYGNSGATFAINVASNTATITLLAATNTAANANAAAIIASITPGDKLETGNAAIGKQYLKVTTDPTFAITGSNSTYSIATVTVNLEDEFKLHTNFTANTTLLRYWEFYDVTGVPPGQSQYVLDHGNVAANDEMHVVIVDAGGEFTGVPGTVLEVFRNISRATDAKGLDNGSVYYKNVINEQSRYVWWCNDHTGAVSNTSNDVTSSSTSEPINLRFTLGSDGLSESNCAISTLADAWDRFRSKEDVDISLMITGKSRGGTNGGQMANYLVDNIAEPRMDCVVYASPEIGDVVNNRGEELNDVIEFNDDLRNSSYLFVDTGYKLQYDRYNNVNRWIPLNGDMAGLTARTDWTNDPWWAPGGYNRGGLKNIIKLAYSPRFSERDVLYPVGVNPVITEKARGSLLLGNRTRLNIVSSFQDLNIRRLFIHIEKAIAEMAKAFLFEFNDPFTRAQFRNTVAPYLRDVQGRRGIRQFRVRCDETNNTELVIRQDRFVGDIIVLPNRAIAYISLNFVAIGTSVMFSEIESSNIQWG